jgi:hypothetical protein
MTTEKVREVGRDCCSGFVYKGLDIFIVESIFWKLVFGMPEVDFLGGFV